MTTTKLAADLRELSREMDRVAIDLANCGIDGCKRRAAELRGAAKMARSWAKTIRADKQRKSNG